MPEETAQSAGQIVIVNCREQLWLEKVRYALEKAGFRVTEDYRIGGGTGADRVIVWEEPC